MSCEQCKPKDNRTDTQNRSLHLFYKQLSDECLAKGIELTVSTKELKKSGQIEQVYNVFGSILAERTKGEVVLPPFPSMESLINES